MLRENYQFYSSSLFRDASLPAIAGIPAFSYFSQRNLTLRILSGRKKILVIKAFLPFLFMPSRNTLGHFPDRGRLLDAFIRCVYLVVRTSFH